MKHPLLSLALLLLTPLAAVHAPEAGKPQAGTSVYVHGSSTLNSMEAGSTITVVGTDFGFRRPTRVTASGDGAIRRCGSR